MVVVWSLLLLLNDTETFDGVVVVVCVPVSVLAIATLLSLFLLLLWFLLVLFLLLLVGFASFCFYSVLQLFLLRPKAVTNTETQQLQKPQSWHHHHHHHHHHHFWHLCVYNELVVLVFPFQQIAPEKGMFMIAATMTQTTSQKPQTPQEPDRPSRKSHKATKQQPP